MKSLDLAAAQKLVDKGLLKPETYKLAAKRFNQGGVAQPSDAVSGIIASATPEARQTTIDPSKVVDTPPGQKTMTVEDLVAFEKMKDPQSAQLIPQKVAQLDQKNLEPKYELEAVKPSENQNIRTQVVSEFMRPVSQVSSSDDARRGIEIAGSAARQLDEENRKIDALAQDREERSIAFQRQSFAKLDEALEMLKKQADVNPNRFYQNMSTGQKIMAGIGMLFAGRSAGDVIERAVDRDIEAQKQAFENSKSIVDSAINVYAQMHKIFNDDEKAELAARIAVADNIGRKMDLLASQTNNRIQLMNYELSKEEVQMKKAQLLSEFARKSGAMMGGAIDSLSRDIIDKVPEEYRKQAIEERGQLEATADAVRNVQELYTKAKNIGAIEGLMPFSSKKAELEAMQTSILANVGKVFGPLSGPELDLLKNFVPYASDTPKQIAAKQAQLMQFLRARQKEKNPTPTLRQWGVNIPANLDPSKLDFRADSPKPKSKTQGA